MIAPSLEQALQQAVAHHQAGRLADAERLYRAILQAQPAHVAANHNLGVLAVQVKQPAAALPHFRAALASDPEQPQHWYSTIDALVMTGQVDEALRLFGAACRKGLQGPAIATLARKLDEAAAARMAGQPLPEDAETLKHLALVQQKQGRLTEAEALCRRALACQPEDAETHKTLGNVLLALGRRDEAEACYQQAIACAPDYADAHNNLGALHFAAGDVDRAVFWLRKAHDLQPASSGALHNLGCALYQQGDSVAAMEMFNKALSLPQDGWVVDSAVYLAVLSFLMDDVAATARIIAAFKEQTALGDGKLRTYFQYLARLLPLTHPHPHLQTQMQAGAPDDAGLPVLHVIGESHALPLHHLRVTYRGAAHVCRSRWIPGCKQWHLGNGERNRFKYQFGMELRRLAPGATILLTIGEIDCRPDEGILAAWKKHPAPSLSSLPSLQSLEQLVHATIKAYVDHVAGLAAECGHRIIISGVPATNMPLSTLPADTGGHLAGLIRTFNGVLEAQAVAAGMDFLDVHALTDRGDGIAHGHWHLDEIHLTPAALAEAFRRIDKAPAVNVAAPAALLQAALAHHQAGRIDAAEALYRQMLQTMPEHPDALHLLGAIMRQRGDIDTAIDLIRQAIAANPAEPIYRNSLGVALKEQGRLAEAEACYRQALALRPDYADACYNLGNALQAQGLLDEAANRFREAIRLKPDHAVAYYNLGNVLHAQGRPDDAAASYREAIRLKPDYAEAYGNLGMTLKETGKLDEAIASCRRAIQLRPAFIDAYINLGNALKAKSELDEAIALFQHVIQIQPELAEAHYNLANVFQVRGELDKAIASYRQAIQRKSDFSAAYSNLIFTLDMKRGVDANTLLVERQRWSAACADHLCGAGVFSNRSSPERRLRIGYVSADFRKHSAAVGFGAMLTRFDPGMFDVIAYSNSVAEDSHTHLFRQSVTGWRKIAGLSDAAVADLIRQDGIDILLDLSGHSAGNRLLTFARKPAPIQISAWGYAGGTGMKAMDVCFTDPVIVPAEEKRFFVEEVRYLPSVISAFFPEEFPAINFLPATSGRGITFGSFNRLAKISAESIAAWAEIMLQMPASRMILKTSELDDPGARDLLVGKFVDAGIDPERLMLIGKTSWQEHMAAFNQIDVALDPFPATGGITTLEGLMMGVPVVTLRGNTFAGRGSASILTTLGLTDWIAETPQQYINLAVQKAADLKALAELRRELRQRFKASIIGDTTAYVRVVEAEYRKLWQAWCERQVDA